MKRLNTFSLLAIFPLAILSIESALAQTYQGLTIPDRLIISSTEDIRKRADDLVSKINSSSDGLVLLPAANKTGELKEVRTIRTLLSKRLYELKGFADHLKNSRIQLVEQLQRKIPTEEEKRGKLESLQVELEDARFEKINVENGRQAFLAKQMDEKDLLKDLQARTSKTLEDPEVKVLTQKVKSNDRSAKTDEAYYQNELKKVDRKIGSIERNMKSIESSEVLKSEDVLALNSNLKDVSELISQAQNTIRLSDDTLASLDETSGILLQTDLMNLSYSDRSTWVFGLLVGIVIFGFFAVAARSEKVREVVFSGDSGIQFITLFSLVIAIILFGILRILEGKELSALLGGLSGYILGRSGGYTTRRPEQM